MTQKGLIPLDKRSPEEAHKIRAAGGKARGAQLRKYKAIKDLVKMMLREAVPDGDGQTWAELLVSAQLLKAGSGDTNAFEKVLKAGGEYDDKAQNVNVISVSEGVAGARRRFKGR